MFVNMDQTLKEFNRILKPGGKIYLNYNSVGWYLHYIIKKGILGREVSYLKTGLKYIIRTILNKRDKHFIISDGFISKKLNGNGFKVEEIKQEGKINNADLNFKPIHKSSFLGFDMVHELIAEKEIK